MDDVNTDTLRALAPSWSLAGDEQLLNLLQKTHQIIISKCQEVNTKLVEMATTLDNTSINLQNVNNKFMALSNSQFIESRVYDDVDVIKDTPPVKDDPKPAMMDEISVLKQSLSILESMHEATEIIDDSDSDDSDIEISVVLKPKDMYRHRPLPHIIGSQPWKNKWHAGLIVEDSDSESCSSRQDKKDVELYSETESEGERTVSECSSAFNSDQVTVSDVEPSPSAAHAACVPAGLARRPGAPAQIVQEEYLPPVSSNRKVYKPEQPATSVIFSDEPPPLDNQSSESQSDDDIFAEINKNQPYVQKNTVGNNLADDLFGFNDSKGDSIFDDFPKDYVTKPSVQQNSDLFEEKFKPESVNHSTIKENNQSSYIEKEDVTVKKPVGGISLFGSNKGAESIGAAILKRTRRKSSTSGEDSDTTKIGSKSIENLTLNVSKEINKAVNNTENKKSNKEKDIFDNLFAKSEKPSTKDEKETVKESSKVKNLFSDNIFDDIDDIFTSNIKMPPKESKQKSLFDDDELFTDVPKPNSKAESIIDDVKSKENASIFDSDDDLFSDVKAVKKTETTEHVESPSKHTISEEDNKSIAQGSFKTKETIHPVQEFGVKISNVDKAKHKSIFDSDSDDDIFASTDTKKSLSTNPIIKETQNLKTNSDIISRKDIANIEPPKSTLNVKNSKVIESPSLFEEEEIDDLFINSKVLLKDTHINEIQSPTISNLAYTYDSVQVGNNFVDANDSRVNISKNVPKIATSKLNDEFLGQREISKNTVFFEDNLLRDDMFISPEYNPSRRTVPKETPRDVIESRQRDGLSTGSHHKNVSTINYDNHTQHQSYHPNSTFGAKTHVNTVQAGDSNNESIFDDFKEPINVTSEQTKPIPEVDIFSKIFTEPPAFEKTIETKKNQNVNALFGDDSDDEALFFKKDAIVTDEKPQVFNATSSFAIFVDEPPVIDVDFVTKSSPISERDKDLFSPSTQADVLSVQPDIISDNNNVDISAKDFNKNQEILNDDINENVSDTPDSNNTVSVTKEKLNNVVQTEITDLDDDIFSSLPKSVIKKGNEQNKFKKNSSEIISDLNIDNTADTKNEPRKVSEETKKIGRLNTKNIIINVNALLPGASPKKVHKELATVEKEDQTMADESHNSPKEITTINKTESNIAQSIENEDHDIETPTSLTFKDEPDSKILDNNLSKRRPRIPVKRRPSSRRARLEAVRKSGIEYEDETDNSTSIDEPVKSKIESQQVSEPNNQEIKSSESKQEKNNKSIETMKANKLEDSSKDAKDRQNTKEQKTTTKIVYVLNDEDIFNDNNKNVTANNVLNRQALVDCVPNTDSFVNKEVTLQSRQTKPLFDESNVELFKSKSKTATKTSIFDSDSEEELFKKKIKDKSNIEKKEVFKRREVKVSLFGDDDDNDLFTVNSKQMSDKKTSNPTTSREVTQKPLQAVDDDPLSMLSDDT